MRSHCREPSLVNNRPVILTLCRPPTGSRSGLRRLVWAALAACTLDACTALRSPPAADAREPRIEVTVPLETAPQASQRTANAQPVVVAQERRGTRYFERATGKRDAELARELAALFAGRDGVARAYLVRVHQSGEPEPVLTVCMASTGPVSDTLVREIGRVYAATHGTAGTLDVLELDPAQERALAGLVPPFHGSPLPR